MEIAQQSEKTVRNFNESPSWLFYISGCLELVTGLAQ